MYKGSNAEKLNSMAMYDLLCEIADNLGICMLEGLGEGIVKHCDENCEECIQEWLNEPHEGGSKNA